MTALIVPGVVSETDWKLPRDLTEWAEIGRGLGRMERSIAWWIGEWWLHGEVAFHGCKAIVTGPDWEGPSYETCKHAALACRRFPPGRRRHLLSFSHHLEAAALPQDQADAVLDRAQRQAEEGKPPGTRDIRTSVKSHRRAAREASAGQQLANRNAALTLQDRQFSVITIDPPWPFATYSEGGKDRSADNHYGTLSIPEIWERRPPMAGDCAVFLWTTAPLMIEAGKILASWGLTYKSCLVWRKPHAGTGYWCRDDAEFLLIATRGQVAAPAPGTQPRRVIEADAADHSRKPAAFAELIERWFPSTPRLEMYARPPFRAGWTVWGNQVAGGMLEVPAEGE